MALNVNFLKFHTKNASETFLFYVFIIGGLFLVWYEAFHILPYYVNKGTTNNPNFHLFFAVWFAVNIFGNMYKMVSIDITGRHIISPTGDAPKGWKYCPECVKNRPERSHHCPLCDVCVLKRDHHCFFAGYCVGYHNHRYYVAMVFYISVAAIYGNIFNFEFVRDVKGELGIWGILSFLLPHVGFLLGGDDFYVTGITMLTFIGFLLLILFLWLLGIQINQILKGQTKFEAKKGITTYSVGLKRVLREIGGKNWFLILLNPWIPSDLPGDGTSFEKNETKTL
ncbi:probable palmitoyltransferase ZDHHC24 [Mytilus trossulus]|uniref:probable palmitoyltransferase ZDHHC24 n=1 Tax=Mytilus trossulus TaxID=6551 RepID=UPI00300470F0